MKFLSRDQEYVQTALYKFVHMYELLATSLCSYMCTCFLLSNTNFDVIELLCCIQ